MVADIDPGKLQLFQFILFTKLEGAFTSALVHLGDRLGLYRRRRTVYVARARRVDDRRRHLER